MNTKPEKGTRPFEAVLDGYTITGTVTRPVNSEICDYYVHALIKSKTSEHGQSVYDFRMIMVTTPPQYAVNTIDNVLAIGTLRKRLYVQVSRSWAGIVFEKALEHCVAYHKKHFEDPKCLP